jgi:hypothetical protein
MAARLHDVTGYRVFGRHGFLGTVVEMYRPDGELGGSMVVRGGISDALRFHVPTELVSHVSGRTRCVRIEVDVEDFAPRLIADGTVELHLGR